MPSSQDSAPSTTPSPHTGPGAAVVSLASPPLVSTSPVVVLTRPALDPPPPSAVLVVLVDVEPVDVEPVDVAVPLPSDASAVLVGTYVTPLSSSASMRSMMQPHRHSRRTTRRMHRLRGLLLDAVQG